MPRGTACRLLAPTPWGVRVVPEWAVRRYGRPSQTRGSQSPATTASARHHGWLAHGDETVIASVPEGVSAWRHAIDTDALVPSMTSGPAFALADIRSETSLKYCTGVYTLWLRDRFLYCGMAYRASQPTANGDGKWGIWGRLRTHADGASRKLNQKVVTRFVVPTLTEQEIQAMAAGEADDLLAVRAREWIADHLGYRAAVTETGTDARRLEALVRREGLPGHGPPELNPS